MEPAELERTSRSRVVSNARIGRGRSALLHTVYYDTPDGLLWSNGVALRLRRAGNRWMQTLKGAGEEIGGLHQRVEIEWPVVADTLDFDVLLDTPFAKLFRRPKVRNSLSPVFETEFRRRSIDVDLPGGTRALLCLDSGEIRAGGTTEAISEVEVELVRGETSALLDFAGDLLGERVFRMGMWSKAERGHALVSSAGNPAPVRAGRIDLEGISNSGEAFSRIVRSAAVQVHGNVDGFLEHADPEYLHQLRVGLRRLRVALSLPRDESWESASRSLRDRIRLLSRTLGEARNWDVFAGEVLKPMATHCDAKMLAGLRSRTGLRRSAALASARAALVGRETTQIWLDLARLLTGPRPGLNGSARQFAAASLNLRYRRLFKAAENIDSPEAMHRLRICAKKLRYLSEFFAGLYPRHKVKRFISSLGALQEELGAVNDAATCRKLVAQADAGAKPLGAEARGVALGWIAAGGALAEVRARGAIKAPMDADPYWK